MIHFLSFVLKLVTGGRCFDALIVHEMNGLRCVKCKRFDDASYPTDCWPASPARTELLQRMYALALSVSRPSAAFFACVAACEAFMQLFCDAGVPSMALHHPTYLYFAKSTKPALLREEIEL